MYGENEALKNVQKDRNARIAANNVHHVREKYPKIDNSLYWSGQILGSNHETIRKQINMIAENGKAIKNAKRRRKRLDRKNRKPSQRYTEEWIKKSPAWQTTAFHTSDLEPVTAAPPAVQWDDDWTNNPASIQERIRRWKSQNNMKEAPPLNVITGTASDSVLDNLPLPPYPEEYYRTCETPPRAEQTVEPIYSQPERTRTYANSPTRHSVKSTSSGKRLPSTAVAVLPSRPHDTRRSGAGGGGGSTQLVDQDSRYVPPMSLGDVIEESPITLIL